MNIMKSAGIVILFLFFITGCSENYGKVKAQSESNSKATQRELIENWSDYNIWLNYSRAPELRLIVFDPKNDDKKILVGSDWIAVTDPEIWTAIVKTNTTIDGEFSLAGAYWGTSRVQEIWSPDNQLYGFIIHQQNVVEWVNVKLVDNNTMYLSWTRPTPVGNPL